MNALYQNNAQWISTRLKHAKRLLSLVLLLGWAGMAWADTVGTVTHLAGIMTARHADGGTVQLAVQSQVQQGDTLITDANTFARVKFVDSAEIVLRPDSQLVVKTYLYNAGKPQDGKVFINLVKGGLRALTGRIGQSNHEAVSFQTPTATIGIRGTDFGALVCQDDCAGMSTANGRAPENGMYVDVAQGAVVVSNAGGQGVYQAGQFCYVANANTKPILILPSEAVPVTVPSSLGRNESSNQ